MPEVRHAVLIANGIFPKEPKFQPLRCPENDAEGMREILTSKTLGLFDPSHVTVLKNAPHYDVQLALNQVLRQSGKDDLVLIYYSGHGLLDELSRLHLATSDTFLGALESTSVPMQQIKSYIDLAYCNKIALILDCCYSGAAGDVFMKSNAVEEQLKQVSGGQGVYVLTASTSAQIAQEKETDRYGLLTKHILEGLGDWSADTDGDGFISVDELYAYVHRQVREESPQNPQKFALKVEGDLILGRTGRVPREERKERMRAYLLDLANKRLISDVLLTKALEIVSTRAVDLSKEARRYDDLLDQLVQKRLEIGEFIEEWYRNEASPALRHAENVVQLPQPVVGEAARAEPTTGSSNYILQRTLPKHTKGVLAGAFSPGGSQFASAGGDGGVQIWDVRTGEMKRDFPRKEGPIWAIAFSPDGAELAAGGADRLLHIWSTVSAKEKQRLPGATLAILSVTFSQDGRLIAAGGCDDTIWIWGVAAEGPITIQARQRGVNRVLFTRDCKRIASAGFDSTIRIWEVEDGRPVKTLQGHGHSVFCLTLSADGETLVSGSRDGTVRLWDTSAWVPRRTFRGHGHSVLSVAFHPGGKILASVSADGTIKFWDAGSGETIRSVESGHICVHFVAFSPNGQQIASGGADQTVRFWQPAEMRYRWRTAE